MDDLPNLSKFPPAKLSAIQYVNLSPVIIQIRGVENGVLAVPVNNTLVHHMAFLAADT